MRDFIKNNPLLASCFGLVGCGVFIGLVLVLVMGFGFKAVVDKTNLRPIGLIQDGMKADFVVNYSNNNGAVVITFEPLEPRPVTCEELWSIVLPNLKNQDVELTLHSTSSYPLDDGQLQPVELECRREIKPEGSVDSPLP